MAQWWKTHEKSGTENIGFYDVLHRADPERPHGIAALQPFEIAKHLQSETLAEMIVETLYCEPHDRTFNAVVQRAARELADYLARDRDNVTRTWLEQLRAVVTAGHPAEWYHLGFDEDSLVARIDGRLKECGPAARPSEEWRDVLIERLALIFHKHAEFYDNRARYQRQLCIFVRSLLRACEVPCPSDKRLLALIPRHAASPK
jgi:hypothetical protein